LLDTNVFIAAAKRGWTRTTDLVLALVESEEDLIANDALIGEYKKYARELGDYSQLLLDQLFLKVVVLEIPDEAITRCKPLFRDGQEADILHSATCLSAGGILISNDRHFDRIKEARIIEVWTISEAIAEML
jgi:predicted nucleic acid-binding protein